MVGPALPDKETWRAFKAHRNDFQPGTCEHCHQPVDKLVWTGTMFVCPSCKSWIETHGQRIAQKGTDR